MPRLNIGNSDFRKTRRNGDYYVDKTFLVRDVLDGGEVILMPRPRRFGKTLNMSMLHYFFSRKFANEPELFQGLNVSADPEAMSHRGQYPVIYLSLKDISGSSWDKAQKKMTELVSEMYLEHQEVLASLEAKEKANFENLCLGKAGDAIVDLSLKKLVSALHAHHKQQVVVIIDEYDSPIIEAHNHGYYREMVDFMRAWMGGGLKHEDGGCLFKGVVTGILRIAKESIFSDLNNLTVSGILTPLETADKFGFTENEVKSMLKDFSMAERFPEVSEWYNGYTFGGVTIYNPWSVVNFIRSGEIGPKWLNSSSNTLIHEELKVGGDPVKRDLEKLLAGEELRHEITENTIFSEIGRNAANIWSFLCFSGYLNATDRRQDPLDTTCFTYQLSIPNMEVSIVYSQFIRKWQEEANFTAAKELLNALVALQFQTFERHLNDMLLNLLSFHDTGKYPETAYHCFVLELLANLRQAYEISSNPETGYGRADITMRPKLKNLKPAFVIEFKSIDKKESVENATEDAQKQIEEKNYAAKLQEAGVPPEDIHKLAIVVQGKKAAVTPC